MNARATLPILAFLVGFAAFPRVADAAPGALWPERHRLVDVLPGDEPLRNPRDPAQNARARSEAGNALRGSFENCPHDYDALHYQITFSSVDENAGTLTGVTTILLESSVASLASIDLDLKAPLVVSSVLRDGVTPLAFSHAGDVLTVTFDVPAALGDTVSVDVAYGGVPYHEVGLGSFGGFWFNNLPRNAYSMGVALNDEPPSMGRAWFPCWDWPCDKATVALDILVPLNRTAVANGALLAVDSTATDHTFHWSHEFPTSTYLMAMSVAPYRVLEDSIVTDPRIDVYFHQGNRPAAEVSFQYTDLMMECFEARYGPYPFETFKFMTTIKGDMEHQTCVSHALSLVDSSNTYDPILAHEMAHQWFGDCVTYGDWRDTWLSEGFATYSEAVFREYQFGTAAYHSYMSNVMGQVLASGEIDGVYAPTEKWGVVAYEKGASVLHMLRGVLDDDDLFWQVLRDYHTNHAYANAVTSDFIAGVSATVGSDMTWFLDPWILGEGHPVYEYAWGWVDLGGGQYRVDVTVNQVQTTANLFDMPVDVRVSTASGDHEFSTQVAAASEFASFIVTDVPTGLALDPNDWILDEQQLGTTSIDYGPAALAAQSLQLLPGRPNPFSTRAELRYYVPSAGPVEVAIFDVTGRRVRTLASGVEQIGSRTIYWDRRDGAGAVAAPGVYWVRLTAREGERAPTVVVVD